MMIDDPDLRLMFKAECEERLQNLEQQLLQLEKQPELVACQEEIFREAHSLKGSARMLNVKNMEQVAHHFESVLKAAIKAGKHLENPVIESLYHAVDDLRGLADEAITGNPYPKSINQILASLESGGRAADKPAVGPQPASLTIQPLANNGTIQNDSSEAQFALHLEPTATARIDTIRVGTQQLDALMTHVSELTVNKNRLAQRLTDINDILFIWDEWKQYNRQLLSPDLNNLEARLLALRGQLYEDNNRFDYLNNEIGFGIRSIRLLPLSTTFNLFPRMVRDIAKQQQKQIDLVIEGDDTVADKRVIEEIKDPLTHLLRNAIDHAIESPEQRQLSGKPAQGTIRLKAYQTPTTIVISIIDDGSGIDLEKIKSRALQHKLFQAEELAAMSERQLQELIFNQGFSTAEQINDISGRGLGMAIVRSKIEQLKGHIDIDSTFGQGTTIQIVLPITLATSQVVIVELQKRYYGFPMESIELIRSVSAEQLFNIDGCQTLLQDQQAVSVARLADLLELSLPPAGPQPGLAVIIAVKQGRVAVLVDRLLDEQEILLKPFGGVLKRVRNVSGVTVLGNGEVCIILNPYDLVKTANGKKLSAPIKKETHLPIKNLHILYAEDSVTTRTQIKRVLEKAGFTVTATVDGRDAYEKLAGNNFAAVVSDVTMPNMDGLQLAKKIRSQARYQHLPIILLSAMDKADDRQMALELGVNAYLSKSAFDHRLLLENLKNLI